MKSMPLIILGFIALTTSSSMAGVSDFAQDWVESSPETCRYPAIKMFFDVSRPDLLNLQLSESSTGSELRNFHLGVRTLAEKGTFYKLYTEAELAGGALSSRIIRKSFLKKEKTLDEETFTLSADGSEMEYKHNSQVEGTSSCMYRMKNPENAQKSLAGYSLYFKGKKVSDCSFEDAGERQVCNLGNLVLLEQAINCGFLGISCEVAITGITTSPGHEMLIQRTKTPNDYYPVSNNGIVSVLDYETVAIEPLFFGMIYSPFKVSMESATNTVELSGSGVVIERILVDR